MTVEEKVRYITQRYPDFAKKTIRDEDSRGNVFYDMIIENEKNPSMPLTLSVLNIKVKCSAPSVNMACSRSTEIK